MDVLIAVAAGRMADICPLVLITAPVERSSMIQPFTPGFLDRRCRASSMESAPVAGFSSLCQTSSESACG